jgi:glycosyltransferase involved in cell wall biosynthesis
VTKLHSTIISVGCNCSRFVRGWYYSLINQTIKDFSCMVAIDPSTDRTYENVMRYVSKDKRFFVIKHDHKNYGALYNRYIGTKRVTNPEEVIIHLDLDDAFYTKKAIERIFYEYNKHDCWLTYGSYICNDGRIGVWNKEISNDVWRHNSHRKNDWSTSALRTFKKWLWDKIDTKDFLMPDGTWIKKGTDQAFMYPMLEMAGKERVRYIKDILYLYNRYGQERTYSRQYEDSAVAYIRNRKPYKILK